MRLLFTTLFLIFTLAVPVTQALPVTDAVPGGIMLLPLEVESQTRPQVEFMDRKAAVVPDEQGKWMAVIGLPLSLEVGEHAAYLHNGKEKVSLTFAVQDKAYETQHLTIKNKRKVEPNKEDLDRIWAERKKKKKALNTWEELIPDLGFIKPVEGRTSSQFGLRRYFNGKPRNPHGGLDIAAPEGTPIKAPADATVLLADDFFFSGNVVYLDHGQGVITYYAHMSEHKVSEGDQVKKGQVIGLVGMTGRVTGPHLHWGVYLNRTAVNPSLFLTEVSTP
jgi:murein DD-endopeptidase MepM/ murein hydrolase activator NlpD